ncbi:hypothetical protein H0H93_009232 [Arthromyces matolae]|nr:hypothetical protein H0H93_009232 [Arthromyces matolae]
MNLMGLLRLALRKALLPPTSKHFRLTAAPDIQVSPNRFGADDDSSPGGKKCGFNGENCSLLELTMKDADPAQEGSGSSADISLIPPHAFSVTSGFSYWNGCDGQGANCITFFSNTLSRAKAGKFLRVPLLLGSTENEADVFIVGSEIASGNVVPNLGEVISDLSTLIEFTCPTGATALDRINAKVPTWRYDYQAVFHNISPRPDLRAYHGSELPILFGTLPSPTSAEKALSRFMQNAWVAFARDPVHGLVDIRWPQYSPNASTLAQIGGFYNETGATFGQGRLFDFACSDTEALSAALGQLLPLFGPAGTGLVVMYIKFQDAFKHALAHALYVYAHSTGLYVTTAQGPVVGSLISSNVRQFLGVPYATGKRWEAPTSPPRRTTPINATSFGDSYPQALDALNVQFYRTAGLDDSAIFVPESENCLYVNIWAPSVSRKQRTAVLIWIYGGSFQFGSAPIQIVLQSSLSWYHGQDIVENNDDITVVSFNYRLNIFNAPYAPQLVSNTTTPQNFGLLDIDAAIGWVYENIAVFGGDPNRISLFGQSAGAAAADAMTVENR